jgi:hypothetical protein
MAICSGDCQDQGCKMIAECERIYKGSHPPCSDIVESAPSASTNSDYAAALRACSLFRDSGIDINLECFEQWCFKRLNSEEPNCA